MPLPATRQEVRDIAHLMDIPTTLLGAHASEQELVARSNSGELATFDVIHLAAHAFIDDQRPERSSIFLSLGNRPDPVEAVLAGARVYDGRLSAGEIMRDWHISADLVTLSACESGLGREVPGEGFVGFADALFFAGARSLLLSLWKVEDRATALLMHRFYDNLVGGALHGGREASETVSKARALSDAKRWLRDYEEDGSRPFAHPIYWSGFVLFGDPQ
jgi:CHAT domain-containing protein